MLRRLVPIVLLFYPAGVDAVRAQAADFGFRFEVGDCLTERLDTFSGVFTKELGGDAARTATAHLSLTESQMTAIYRAIEDIRFVDFPATFQGVPAGTQEVTTTVPYATYRFGSSQRRRRSRCRVEGFQQTDDRRSRPPARAFLNDARLHSRTSRVQTSPCSDRRLHVAHFSSPTVGARTICRPDDCVTVAWVNRVGIAATC